MIFRRRKSAVTVPYDKAGKIPVIHSSICTGEQVAGFKEITTGKFHEVMLLQTEADYQEFLRLYGVEESEIKREW